MRPEVEELEARQVPARVGVSLDLEGTLVVRGTPHADQVEVIVGDDLVVVRAGRLWWGFDPWAVTGLRFTGRGGADRLEVRFGLVDDPEPVLEDF